MRPPCSLCMTTHIIWRKAVHLMSHHLNAHHGARSYVSIRKESVSTGEEDIASARFWKTTGRKRAGWGNLAGKENCTGKGSCLKQNDKLGELPWIVQATEWTWGKEVTSNRRSGKNWEPKYGTNISLEAKMPMNWQNLGRITDHWRYPEERQDDHYKNWPGPEL